MKTKAPPGKLGGVFSYFWMEQLRQAFGPQGHNVIPTRVMKLRHLPGNRGVFFLTFGWNSCDKPLARKVTM